MFSSIGMFEILFIAGGALIVLGPEKFPGFAKMAVRTFRDLKKYLADAQREIASELNPMKDELNSLKKIDVEKYVDKLIGEDEASDDDASEDDKNESEEEIEGEYNGEPESSVIDDWYPEDMNEIMPGSDETAEDAKANELEDVSHTESEEAAETKSVPESVPNQESQAADNGAPESVPYQEPEAPENGVAHTDSEVSVPDREDDFDITGGFNSREEVVDAENPERLDS